MDKKAELEAFENVLDTLVHVGTEKVVWVVFDADRDSLSQLTSFKMAVKKLFPDLLVFASAANTPEEMIQDLDEYIKLDKSKQSSLKVAKENAKKFDLKLGV